MRAHHTAPLLNQTYLALLLNERIKKLLECRVIDDKKLLGRLALNIFSSGNIVCIGWLLMPNM